MSKALYAQESGILYHEVNHPHNLRRHAVLLCLYALLGIFIANQSAIAQERFTVQSSARGMENAKQAAQIRQVQVKDNQQDSRLDAVESDIGKIADHAWKSLAQCGIGGGTNGTGYKITWNPAGSWGCIPETDPTVKAFAKTDLPTCSAGQVLRADGTKFICTSSEGAAGFEVDPYVQDFARNTAYTISACASDEILTMTASRLKCVKSKDLSVSEVDPTVQPFAKAALPECTAGQVLTTGVGSGGVAVLRCVTDTDGGYAELDPSVGTITNSKWCMASGGKIHCNQNPPVLVEADPKIGVLTNNSWCRAVSGKVVCDQAKPETGVMPGGVSGSVEYNADSSLAGNDKFVYNGTTNKLTVYGDTESAINGITTRAQGIGIYGEISDTGSAVYGYANSANGAAVGVDGNSRSTTGFGVKGAASSLTGVTYGGRFTSASSSGRGVSGYASATSGSTTGVHGEVKSSSGKGVYGYASAASGMAFGVEGFSRSTSGRGVYGYAGASTGTTYGVYGQVLSPDGYGVYSNGRMHTTKALTVADSVTATAYYQSSDRNLKENITPVQNPFALLNAIEGKHYVWKDSKQPAYGVIAQDVEKVMPEAVKATDKGTKTVDYSQLIAPLIEAVKQLKSNNDALQEAVHALKADNDILRAEITAIKKQAR